MEHAENTQDACDRRIRRRGAALGGVREILGPNFLDEAVCRQWILRKLHPRGAFCPRCRAAVRAGKSARFWSGQRIVCSGCGKDFSARTGTFLAGAALNCRELVFLCWLLGEGHADRDIAARMCLNRESVRLWRKKLRRMASE